MSLYLITGGAGFIGSHLAHSLTAQGHTIRVLDNLSSGRRDSLPPGSELVMGDICDTPAVEQALMGVDGCFHLAAIASVQKSIEEPAACHAVNGPGTFAVFTAAAKLNVPVVYASSAAVYGACEAVPLRETEYPMPLSPYAADKFGNEMQARALGHALGLRSFGLRFFNVYGPRQDPSSPYSGVISRFNRMVLDGRSLVVHGDGLQQRDFVHVSDVVRFLAAAMDKASACGEVVNVCSGRGTTILELGRLMAAALGHGDAVRIERQPSRPGDIRLSVGCPRRAAELLGLQADIPLSEGLRLL